MKNLKELPSTLNEFRYFLASQEKATLVAFTSQGYNGLFLMQASLKLLQDLHEDQLDFFHLNADQAPEIVGTYQICQIPTFLLFYQTKLIECIPGLTAKTQLINQVQEALLAQKVHSLNPEPDQNPGGILLQ